MPQVFFAAIDLFLVLCGASKESVVDSFLTVVLLLIVRIKEKFSANVCGCYESERACGVLVLQICVTRCSHRKMMESVLPSSAPWGVRRKCFFQPRSRWEDERKEDKFVPSSLPGRFFFLVLCCWMLTAAYRRRMLGCRICFSNECVGGLQFGANVQRRKG